MTEKKVPLTLTGGDYLKLALQAPVYDVACVTPLEKMEKLSRRLHNAILVKREDRQCVYSFKIRGAQALIASLTQQERQRGIIAASAGNHAQGVALAATKLGIDAVIVMPVTSPDIKVDAVKRLGGTVILYGDNFDDAKNKAQQIAAAEGRLFIPPFDHPLVIAGQGTIALELLQQQTNIDYIFVPVGGGGLAAGIATLIKHLQPVIKIIGVEPVDSAALCVALAQGGPATLEYVGNFSDGVAVKRIGDETYRLCKQYLDDVITVDSDAICAAVKDIFDDTRAIAEPSGALSLAGMKKYIEQHQITEKTLIHVISGANTNFHSLRYISERCELGEKRELLLAVIIPEQKGSFLAFCRLLGKRVITEFNYRYSSPSHANVFVGIRLAEGTNEAQLVIDMLRKHHYRVLDISNNEAAKLHVRYMVGGKPCTPLNERIYRFEFPEAPGALLKFLQSIGQESSISLFHYRSHGADYGRVLIGFDHVENLAQFECSLKKVGYNFSDETENPAFSLFLTGMMK